MFQGKRVSLGFPLWSQHWGMNIIQAPARQGEIDAEGTCTAVLLLLLAQSWGVWRRAGTGWTQKCPGHCRLCWSDPSMLYLWICNTKFLQRYSLCYLFSMNICSYMGMLMKRGDCDLIFGIFHFPLPGSVSGWASGSWSQDSPDLKEAENIK